MQEATQAVTEVRPTSSPGVLIDAWETWMDRTRNLSPNTRQMYRRTVEVFSSDVPKFLKAEEKTIQAWLQAQGGQAGTFNNRVSALTSFYRWAKKSKLRKDNPCTDLDRPKQHKRLPKPVKRLNEALKALDDADRRANEYGPFPRRVGQTRDMAVFLCETGLRIHEAVACNWPVPCPDEMPIIGKDSKEAMLPITQKAQDAWNRLGGKWPIGARATQRRFEKAGPVLAFTPHQCRHWRATSLIQAGVPIATVSKIMRHSSIQTTMGYSEFAQDQYREALAMVP